MVYVALLRGVNVGGKGTVSMTELKQTFEKAGMEQVRTYINSGNVVFASTDQDKTKLTISLERAIEEAHKLPVKVLLKTLADMRALHKKIPSTWIQGKELKCDVAFLWPDIDKPAVLNDIPVNKAYEDVRYLPGAVIRKIAYADYKKGRFHQIIGTPVYKSMTLRNTNTVRKILELMEQIV